tara:strand:- start:3083 stop:5260 length:2178 start_codon:yes stop_codon:yes gene_type:complete
MSIGYIYIRHHPTYSNESLIKLGRTTNIPERDSTYVTGEIDRGTFILVIEFENPNHSIYVERLLKYNFAGLNVKRDGGTEFFKKEIIEKIEPYLNELGIKYEKLTKQEINNLTRSNRVKEIMRKIHTKSLIKLLNIPFIQREYQTSIIRKSVRHFQQYDKGMLVLICGVGKTLISLWITQELNSNTILVGVPNTLLLKQWEEVISSLFQNIPCLTVSSGKDEKDIMTFLKKNQQKCIVISTYSSSHKVNTATKDIGFIFGMKIYDEVHHLTTKNMQLTDNTKKYTNMLKIESIKQLSLTATLKILEKKEDVREEDIVVISNDNVEYFGEIIDRRCLLWAIDKYIICDYVIQTIVTKEEQLKELLERFNITEENDKRLFLSAFATLKSISEGHSHHLLIYSNNKDNSDKLRQYIKMLLDDNYFDIPDLYYSNYHSEMNSTDQKEIITKFDKAKFGIIPCVYCLGEGWDFPLLDGVVFSENMVSGVRIVQSALRASRKNKKDTTKKTKIILPILNRDDWLDNNENPDLKKVREVIYQMGLEDETIEQKIKVYKIDIEKQKPKQNLIKNQSVVVDDFGDYDDELTRKLRLKTVKRTALATTYEKARKIIANKNIKSKEDYYDLCKRDNRLSEKPWEQYYGNWKGWVDYLSVNKYTYYNEKDCKERVIHFLNLEPELKYHITNFALICQRLFSYDPQFPPPDMWEEMYYPTKLSEIIVINIKKKKKGIE